MKTGGLRTESKDSLLEEILYLAVSAVTGLQFRRIRSKLEIAKHTVSQISAVFRKDG
jgi:hypothetical protein